MREVIRTGLVHSAQEELLGHIAGCRSFRKSAVGEVDAGVDHAHGDAGAKPLHAANGPQVCLDIMD